MKVLSFDIGVKNLAWCLTGETDTSSRPWSVLDWGVWDLRVDLEDEPMRPEQCSKFTKTGKPCNKEPVFVEMREGVIIGGLCKCHSKHSGTSITSDDIKSLKTKSVSFLKKKVEELGMDSRHRLKRELISDISSHMEKWYLHKIPPLKKSKTIPLHLIHSRIIERLRDIHINVDKIVIENQPVRMNAMMKSVQMILWTTLRMKMLEAGIEEPVVNFVNASRKLTVIPNETNIMGYHILSHREVTRQARGRTYADRKRESILRVEHILTITGQNSHIDWFRKNSKKDDLADCLLMCLESTTSV